MTRKQFVCLCGYKANGSTASSHTRRCKMYEDEKQRIKEYISVNGKDAYLQTYSVSECVDQISQQTVLGHKTIRHFFEEKMRALGILEGVKGPNQQRMKQSKIQLTTFNRHGVTNMGKKTGGWAMINSVPYEKLNLLTELSQYRDKVNKLTWNSFMRMNRKNLVPTTCYYTDIPFNDILLEKVNPNDPYKRTIDHIVPVTEAFFKGWSPEQTSTDSNIVFCLRVINTLKSNTNHDDFVKNYLPHIIEKLNESKDSPTS